MNKISWRITPAMSQNRPSWALSTVSTADNGATVTNSFGYFSTLKAAKRMAAHMKRKPINL